MNSDVVKEQAATMRAKGVSSNSVRNARDNYSTTGVLCGRFSTIPAAGPHLKGIAILAVALNEKCKKLLPEGGGGSAPPRRHHGEVNK